MTQNRFERMGRLAKSLVLLLGATMVLVVLELLAYGIGRIVLPEKAGDAFLDYSRVFAETAGTAYVGWVHYSPLGTEVIGAHLGDEILRRIAQGPESR